MNEQKNPQEVLLKDIAATLKSIRSWVAFFGIVVILALVGGCLIAVQGWAGTASIVSSFKSPCANIYGIDYHDGYLYHADNIKGGYIYQTNTMGSITARVRNLTGARGIDRTASEFWVCSYDGWTHRLSTSGSILSSFKVSGLGEGITLGTGYLWYTDGFRVCQVTLNGSLVRSFNAPGTRAFGICWKAANLWIVNPSNHYIYRTKESGSVIGSFRTTAIPYGVAWDSSYIWYSAGDYVYRARVLFTALVPVSLGKVKALYR